MKRLTIIALLAATTAWAGYIVDTTSTNPLSGDKVPIGRAKGGTSYSVTVDSLATYAVKSGKAATFTSISTNAITVPQGSDEQSVQLYEAAANGNNSIVIKPMANMSSSRTVTFGNHGMFVDGVQVLSW